MKVFPFIGWQVTVFLGIKPNAGGERWIVHTFILITLISFSVKILFSRSNLSSHSWSWNVVHAETGSGIQWNRSNHFSTVRLWRVDEASKFQRLEES